MTTTLAQPANPPAVAARALEDRLAGFVRSVRTAAKQGADTPEQVHRLRVRARRAAAALDLFADFVPRKRAERIGNKLTRVRRAANDARDGDVLTARLEGLPPSPATERWLERIAGQRAAAREHLTEVAGRVNVRRLRRRVRRLLARVRDRSAAHAADPAAFAAWAADRLGRVADAFFAAAPHDPTDPVALHRFRLHGKRLRYTLELLAGSFPEAAPGRVRVAVKLLQDLLGEANDLAAAAGRARRRSRRAADAAEAAAWRALVAELDDRHRAAVRAYADRFPPSALAGLRDDVRALLAPPAAGGA